MFLYTKFGVKVTDKVYSMRSDPEYAREACERCLRSLGVNKIDLYYCHRVDLKTPIEKTMEALVQLKTYAATLTTFKSLCFVY
jgi:aryl-alcohol dehydrogenase-like predicted oxidoreductase